MCMNRINELQLITGFLEDERIDSFSSNHSVLNLNIMLYLMIRIFFIYEHFYCVLQTVVHINAISQCISQYFVAFYLSYYFRLPFFHFSFTYGHLWIIFQLPFSLYIYNIIWLPMLSNSGLLTRSQKSWNLMVVVSHLSTI